jgi:hypothetical protein
VGELERLVLRGPRLDAERRIWEALVEHAPAEAALDRFVLDLLGAERASLHGVVRMLRPDAAGGNAKGPADAGPFATIDRRNARQAGGPPGIGGGAVPPVLLPPMPPPLA